MHETRDVVWPSGIVVDCQQRKLTTKNRTFERSHRQRIGAAGVACEADVSAGGGGLTSAGTPVPLLLCRPPVKLRTAATYSVGVVERCGAEDDDGCMARDVKGGAVDTGMARDVDCGAVEPGMARDVEGGGVQPGMACDVLGGCVEMVSTLIGSGPTAACQKGVVHDGSFSISAYPKALVAVALA
ncbi:unnamed protein product [Closterium sp. NIES-54]